jgi:hypothetical protein
MWPPRRDNEQSGVAKGSWMQTALLFRHLDEHFHQNCSDQLKSADSGLFDFWRRFGSVAGFFKPAPSPKPRQKPKILATLRYIFSVNAPKLELQLAGLCPAKTYAVIFSRGFERIVQSGRSPR